MTMCACRRAFRGIARLRTVDSKFLPARNTWILRRINPIPVSPRGGPLHKLRDPTDYVYEVVENTEDVPSPPIDIIMTGSAENIGMKGDMLSVDPWVFRHHLRPAGLAVYRTAENERRYAEDIVRRQDSTVPQQTVAGYTTVSFLRDFILEVPMNKNNPWTVTKQHVIAAFRRAGVRLKSHCVDLPSESVNSDAPRDFVVHILVNNIDTVAVKCKILLYSTEEGLVPPKS